MLNIPDSVIALFNSDECRKNFRVHFPNGEHADLTNSDVVQESVSFSESLCSQNVLRFGLTEASTISFETVGVPNLMGVTIECSCEIDTSILTAAEIAAIQAGTWDGTLVLAADSDLGYGYFRVPYGSFRVEDCPRNHGAMAHRKITARTIIGRRDIENPFETAKEALMLPGDTYKPDAYLLTMSGIGWDSPNFLVEQGFTGEELPRVLQIAGQAAREYLFKDVTLKKSDGTDIDVQFWVYSASISEYFSPRYLRMDKLYSIDLHGVDYSHIKDDIATDLSTHGIDYARSGYGSMAALVDDFIGVACYPLINYYVAPIAPVEVPFSRDNYAFYPRRDTAPETIQCRPYMPYRIAISGDIQGDYWSTEIFKLYDRASGRLSDDVATVTEWTPPDGLTGIPVIFKSTAQKSVSVSGRNYMLHSFINAFKYIDFVNGFLELSAHFGKPKRDGTYEVIGLSTANPVSVSRSQYEECWWDEYDIEDVGTIRYAYMGSDGQTQEAEFRFGSGRSVYDMTDNAVLLAMENASRQSIEDTLRTQFIPNLGTFKFTPADLSMLGLPYIEAGDYLEIAAEDGTTVRTYALEYELSGIQHLTAEIHSAGGEIIEEG